MGTSIVDYHNLFLDFLAFPGQGDEGNELASPATRATLTDQLTATDAGSRKRPRSAGAATSWPMAPALRARRSWSETALMVSSFDGPASPLQLSSPRFSGNDSHDSFGGASEPDGPDLMTSMGIITDMDDGNDHNDPLEAFFAQHHEHGFGAEASAAAAGSGVAAPAHVVPYLPQPPRQPPVAVAPSSSSGSSSSGGSEDEEDIFGYGGRGSGSEDEQEDELESLLARLPAASAAALVGGGVRGVGGDMGMGLHEIEAAFADSDFEEEDKEEKEGDDEKYSSRGPCEEAGCNGRKRKPAAAAALPVGLSAGGTSKPIKMRLSQQQPSPSESQGCGRRPSRAAAAASVARVVAALAGTGEDGELQQRHRANMSIVKQEPCSANTANVAMAARRNRSGLAAAEAAATAALVATSEGGHVAKAVGGPKKEDEAAAEAYNHHQQRQQQQRQQRHQQQQRQGSGYPPSNKPGSCDGKLMHIDRLKHQVAVLLSQQRQLEAAAGPFPAWPAGIAAAAAAAAAAAVEISPEAAAAGRKRSAVRRFLDYRSSGVQDRAAWAGLVSESFALVLPVAPYRSCWDNDAALWSGGQGQGQGAKGDGGSLAGGGGTHRLCGIDALVRDTRAISRLVECINARCGYVRPNQKPCNVRLVYRVAPGDTLVSGNRVMCHWRLSTERLCADGGLPRECGVDGMLRCRFDSRELLCSMEVTYDVLGFTQQLRSLGLLPGVPLPVPITRAFSAPAALGGLTRKCGAAPPAGKAMAVMPPAPPLKQARGGDGRAAYPPQPQPQSFQSAGDAAGPWSQRFDHPARAKTAVASVASAAAVAVKEGCSDDTMPLVPPRCP